ncbi:barstar family protein [Thermomonas sp.]|uniref:barstar family protein n=1 Tax=Thermomonas sp. TaxID=1971895 RepID=UPI0032200FD6
MHDDEAFSLDLHDANQAGVYFVTEDDLGTLADSTHDARLLLRTIDLRDCTDKDALLLHLANALEFPADQGRNWDALSDQLRDLSWLPAAGGYSVLLSHTEDLRDADEASFDILLDILDTAVLDWQQRHIPFWVFFALPETEFPPQE